MARKNHGLGRGLDALLPEISDMEAGLQQIGLGEIDPNRDQPRRTFDEESIAALAQSVREQGILQPIVVTPSLGGRYTIVAGERRWRAARAAGLDTIPCVVRDLDLRQQMEIALIENMQREDLNPLEQAQGIQALMRQFGYTQEAAAARLGMSRPAVANLLRLLSLPESLQEQVRTGVLSAGHARVLCGIQDEKLRLSLAEKCVKEDWSVRRLEEEAAASREEPKAARQPRKPSAGLTTELKQFREMLQQTTGLKTTLKGTEKKGRIVLEYATAQELENLYDLVRRMGEE